MLLLIYRLFIFGSEMNALIDFIVLFICLLFILYLFIEFLNGLLKYDGNLRQMFIDLKQEFKRILK